MGKIILKDFKIKGDLFYTKSVLYYINKLNINSVSSSEEIESLNAKVLKMANEEPFIISEIRNNVINAYFTALSVELRNINIMVGNSNE